MEQSVASFFHAPSDGIGLRTLSKQGRRNKMELTECGESTNEKVCVLRWKRES